MARSDDILKKYGVTQVTGGSAKKASSSGSDSSGSSKSILDKYGVSQVRGGKTYDAEKIRDWFSGTSSALQSGSQYLSQDGYRKPNTSFSSVYEKYMDDADDVARFLEDNKSSMENYGDVLDMYNKSVYYLRKMNSNIQKSNEFFSQFSNEDDYNTAVRYGGYYQKYSGQTYGQIQDTLSKMEDGEEKDWLAQFAPSKITDRDYAVKSAQNNTELYYAQKYLDEYAKIVLDSSLRMSDQPHGYAARNIQQESDLLPEIRALNEKYGFSSKQEAEARIEELKAQNWEYQKTREYGFLGQNADYGELSSVVTDDKTAGAGIGIGTRWFGQGDPVYDYINNIDGARNVHPAQEGKTPYSIYDYMDEKEISDYNYLYNAQGKEAAQGYLDYLKYTLDQRRMEKLQENTAAYATDHPVISSALSVPMNLLSGAGVLDVAGQYAARKISGEYKPINYNRRGMVPTAVTTATRGTVAKNIADATGTISLDTEKHPILSRILNGKSLGDVYQLGMSMADSAAIAGLAAVGIPGGTALLGGSAASQGVLDALEAGADDTQALTMGILNGVFEMLFEEVSLEKLLKGNTKGIVRSILEQGAVEGSEEFFTTLANTVADTLVMAEKSDYRSKIAEYMSQGLSENKATLRAIEDIAIGMGWDFVGGMLTGGIMGGVSKPIQNYSYASETGKLLYGSDPGALVSEALETDPENKLAAKMKGKLDSGESVSGYQLYKLAQQNEAALRGHDTDAIQKAASVRLTDLGETGDVEAISAALAKQASGESLSKGEAQLIQESKYGNRVSQELNQENILSGDYASDWAKNIGTKRIGLDVYNQSLEQASIGKSEPVNGTKNDPSAGNTLNTESKTAQNDSIRQAPVEDKPFELSDETGKTLLNLSDGSTVETEITGIASTGKGKLMLNVSGQSEPVRASSISYASTADATLYNAINSMEISPEDAKRFVNLARSSGDTTGEFAVGIQQMYILGKSGVPISKAMNSRYGAKLSDTNKRFGYSIGRAVYDAQVQKAEAEKKNVAASQRARASTGGTKVNGVQYDGLTVSKGKDGSNKPRKIGHVKGYGVRIADMNKALNPTQKKAYNVLTEIAKVTGIDIVLFKSTVDGNGNLVGGIIDGIDMRNSQGAFSFHNNKIYIDLNAGILQGSEMKDVAKYSMLRTFTHEFTHFIEKWSPTEYENLRGIVFDTMKKNGADPDSMIAARMERDNGLTEDQASREVVAESLTDILPQSSFVQNLAEKHRNIFQKLYDKLKEFTARIKDYFDSIGETRSPETQAVKETFGEALRYNDEIVKLFDKAAEVAVENYQDAVADKKSTTQEGGVQYEIRKSFYGEFDAWDGKNPSVTFTIGTTSSALQSIGMKDQEIKMRSGMVISKMNKHPEMKKDLFRQIPELLENPVIVQFSDAIDPKTGKPKYDSSITVLGELYAEVKENGKINKKPVLVSLELMPTRKNSTTVRDFSVVKSAYSKGALQQYINENTILYIDPNTKRTNSWLSLTGLQLPVGENRYGSIRRISYADGKIKVQNSRNSTAFQKALEKAGAVDTFGNPIATRNGGSSHQERTSTLTNLDILQSASNEVDFGELTPAEIDALKIYRNRLSDVQKTEKAVLELQNMENLSVADKNRLNILEKKLERQSANLWEIGQKKVIAGIAEKAKNKLIEKYGTIPTGENPSRKTSVPYRTSDDSLVSRTVRTAIEAAATTDEAAELIQQKVVEGEFSYLPITDDASNKRAEETIHRKGWDNALPDWLGDMRKTAFPGKDMVALGFRLYNNAVNTGDTKNALRILTEITNTVRNSAQVVQAVRILKQLSPENRLYAIKRQIDSLQDELNKRYGEKAPQIDMNSALTENYINAKGEEAIRAAEEALFRDIAAKLPNTFADKWNSWRYLSMLGNLRTHVRNVLGNVGFAPVRATKDLIAYGIESGINAISKDGIARTKGVLSPVSKSDRALYSAGLSDYAVAEDLLGSANVKSGDSISRIERMRPAFGGDNAVWRALSKVAEMNSNALSVEDMLFKKTTYAAAFGGYLKANGITAEMLQSGKTSDSVLDEARVYAFEEALKATYNDFNDFSNFISKVGSWRYSKNDVKKVAGHLAEGVLPFKRTPANIIARAVEYSPIGLMTGIKQSLFDVRRGNVTAAEAIDSIASGLTGTILLGLGALLASIGLVSGGDDEDDKQRQFDKLRGEQSYAINVFGKSYTIDWLAPEVIPMFVGVELYKSVNSDGSLQFKDILDSFARVTKPLLEMSCLQSLNDLLDSISYSDSKLYSILAQASASYVLQVLPTVFGQIERIGETEREQTYIDNSSQLPKDFQYTIAKAANKIPGVEFEQIPYIDAYGRRQKTGNIGTRMFSNLLSPGYLNSDRSAPWDDELQRLYDLGYSSVLPSQAAKKIGDRELSAEEYVRYATYTGQERYRLLGEVTESDYYAQSSDADKEDILKDLYTYVNAKGSKLMIPDREIARWTEKAMEMEKLGYSFTDFLKMKNEAVNENGNFTKDVCVSYIEEHFPKSKWKAVWDIMKDSNWKDVW